MDQETGSGQLPSLTLRGLRVGDATVSIRFERRADGSTDHDVLTKEGTLHILTFPPPQDTDTRDERWRDRLKEWFFEHAPGRTAAALRFALGVLET